uniref:Guanylate cyclase domain-containing protein n=1 Tax=viral metagenome TaxID=1070528 RepID=A0A6C0B5I0_9ZZZZ
MGSGVSSYKSKELGVEQLSLCLIETQRILTTQTQELSVVNEHVRKLEKDNTAQKKKHKRLRCLRYIREHNIIDTIGGKRFFLTYSLHTVTQTMRFPELCEAQIQIFNPPLIVETNRFAKSAYPLELPLLNPNDVGDATIGRIILKYNHSSKIENDDPWTKEEEGFIASVCSLIALKIGCDETKQLLEKTHSQRELLDDILPADVVDTLLNTGEAPPPQSYMCSILFTDVVGFTKLCAQTTPLCVVKMLDDMYTAFDTIVTKSGDALYKMETIGDSYMVVSGVPRNYAYHATEVVKLALALIEAMSSIHIELRDGRMVPIHIRCGIHSGKVVAGIVGTINPRYCLFGDAVNTASRMESTSETMKIQISKETYDCIQQERLSPKASTLLKIVNLVPRDGVDIKGKGVMDTFWVENNEEELCVSPRRRRNRLKSITVMNERLSTYYGCKKGQS